MFLRDTFDPASLTGTQAVKLIADYLGWLARYETNTRNWFNLMLPAVSINAVPCSEIIKYNTAAIEAFNHENWLLSKLRAANFKGVPPEAPFPSLFAHKVVTTRNPDGSLNILQDNSTLLCDATGYPLPGLQVSPTRTAPFPERCAGCTPGGGLSDAVAAGSVSWATALRVTAGAAGLAVCAGSGGTMTPACGYGMIIFGAALLDVPGTALRFVRALSGADVQDLKNQAVSDANAANAQRWDAINRCAQEIVNQNPTIELAAALKTCQAKITAVVPTQTPPAISSWIETLVKGAVTVAVVAGVFVIGKELISYQSAKESNSPVRRSTNYIDVSSDPENEPPTKRTRPYNRKMLTQ